jgi:hypothetical protein
MDERASQPGARRERWHSEGTNSERELIESSGPWPDTRQMRDGRRPVKRGEVGKPERLLTKGNRVS